MATQRTDGTWTPIEAIEPALQTFLTELDLGMSRALHVGTPTEIRTVMEEAGLQEQVDEMKADMLEQLDRIRINLAEKMDRRMVSEILEIPTQEEAAGILKGGPHGDEG